MDLGKMRNDEFLEVLETLGASRFTTKEAARIGQTLGLDYPRVRKYLSRLEKMDKLVRVRFGLYMTMKGYRGAKEGIAP
jgi:predicted transcriptional regulator of viral defense system